MFGSHGSFFRAAKERAIDAPRARICHSRIDARSRVVMSENGKGFLFAYLRPWAQHQ